MEDTIQPGAIGAAGRKVSVRVCKECGARYVTAGLPQRHSKATGHQGWRIVTEIRTPEPMRIAYQPGYSTGQREE